VIHDAALGNQPVSGDELIPALTKIVEIQGVPAAPVGPEIEAHPSGGGHLQGT